MKNSTNAFWIGDCELIEKIKFDDTTVKVLKHFSGEILVAYKGNNHYDRYDSFVNPIFTTHEKELKQKYPSISNL